MDSATLYERAASEVAKAQAIQALADKEERELTDEEQTTVSEHCDAAERYRSKADTAKRLEATINAVSAPHPGVPKTVGGQIKDDPDNEPGPRVEVKTDPAKEARFHFKNFAEQAIAIRDAAYGKVDQRLLFYAAGTGLEQATPSKGGFLMAPAFATSVWDGFSARPNALLPMTDQYVLEQNESMTIPCDASTSRADGSRPTRGYWIAEAAQITASSPTFRSITVEPQELAVLVYVTNKLLNNAGILEQYLRRKMTEEIGFKVDDAIINGTGAGQPLGILASGALISVAKETSQVADSIVTENLNKMRARMHPNFWSGAVWLANQDTLPELLNLFHSVKNVAGSENVGGFRTPVFDPANNTLYGKPVYFIEPAATVGDVGDLMLVNMKALVSATTGRGVETAVSIHLRFDYAESVFRCMWAVDCRPIIQAAMTPFKGTNTLSPFVTIAARA